MMALSHGCFRLAVATAAALAIDFVAAEPPALEARIDAAGKSAVIGNGVVELEISWKQGLRLAHLKNVATGIVSTEVLTPTRVHICAIASTILLSLT